MKLNLVDQITLACANKFRSFGGGRTSDYNPIVNALKDSPPQFAAGVDIKEVVAFVVAEKVKATRRARRRRYRNKPYNWHVSMNA